jgi:ABC-type dipeptide/oligopeptide/nickel transport system permease subunit
MNALRGLACLILAVTFCSALCAPWIAPASYETQFRESPNASPSRQFPLGTDDLGRDRLSRLLYGTRISLLLAPGGARLFWIQVLPNLRAPILAQFWLSIPLFILAEANLGVLGLGVAEPLPSWGNLLLDLVNHREIADAPWRLAPAALLVLVLLALQVLQNPDGKLPPGRRAVAEARTA